MQEQSQKKKKQRNILISIGRLKYYTIGTLEICSTGKTMNRNKNVNYIM